MRVPYLQRLDPAYTSPIAGFPEIAAYALGNLKQVCQLEQIVFPGQPSRLPQTGALPLVENEIDIVITNFLERVNREAFPIIVDIEFDSEIPVHALQYLNLYPEGVSYAVEAEDCIEGFLMTLCEHKMFYEFGMGSGDRFSAETPRQLPLNFRVAQPRTKPYFASKPTPACLGGRMIDEPLIQINIYPLITTLTRRENGRLATYEIDLRHLFTRLTQRRVLSVSTGLLQPNHLAWGMTNDGAEWCVAYFPAACHEVVCQEKKLTIPLPAAVFKAIGSNYTIHAVIGERPTAETTQLYHYPSPNVGQNGQICWGRLRVPSDLELAYRTFLSSPFNTDWARDKCRSGSVVNLWHTLDGEATFPQNELIPSLKLSQLFS